MKDFIVFKNENENLFFHLKDIDLEGPMVIVDDGVKTPASILEWVFPANGTSVFEENTDYIVVFRIEVNGRESLHPCLISGNDRKIIESFSAYEIKCFAKLTIPKHSESDIDKINSIVINKKNEV